ncbi:MAG: hypothetical protein KDJ36_02115 [Hyphomicrobiaceae bacterium]|nr:hypothetical protein [Hyphomicrobiaceae bacterium]
MKHLITLALAGAVSSVALTGALAQDKRFTQPWDCVANFEQLDTNGDGYIDNREAPSFGRVEANVDVNNDGYISREEKVVVCREGVRQGLKPKS